MTGDITVNIGEGTYYLDEMLDFGTEDSGTNGHRVIYQGAGDKDTVISGGTPVEGFKESEYENIYVADFDDESVLQLSVNGERRYVAKAQASVVGVKNNLEDWTDRYNYDNSDTAAKYDGMYIKKSDFGKYENPEDILFVWDRAWATTAVSVEKIEDVPLRNDVLRVTMNPDLWNWYGEKRNAEGAQPIYPDPQYPFTVMNAFELLDEPGEFYYNKEEKKLYYMPMADEDMKTATVIVPKLETLICFDGNDVSDKVKNITLKNLTISDSQWDYNRGFFANQATTITGSGLSATAPRAIYAERADGIEIVDNVINNVGGSAIDFYNAVTNSVIKGNVIYDVGESAILSGARNHADSALGVNADGISNPVPADAKNSPIDLMSQSSTKIYYSYFGLEGGTVGKTENPLVYPGSPGANDSDSSKYDTIHTSWLTGEYKYGDTSWRDNVSAKKGENPYVMFEFLRPYSIDKISLSFTEDVTDTEKSNFEILASNDKNFATYEIIATQNGAVSQNLVHYQFDGDTKYKYVMIRKISAEDFAISRVWIASTDRKPYVKNQRCNNITIENNAIERAGVDVSRSVGLAVTSGENYTIKHNDIRDIGYSGMSVGFSWNLANNTCYNMDVGYNYVYDVCQTMYDGGGIYILGPQVNSHYYNNHIEKTNLALQGFYTDNGSRYELIENNYIENAITILSPYTGGVVYAEDEETIIGGGGIVGNTFRNNYGTHGISNDKAAYLNDWEPAKPTAIGQVPREIYDTYTNAGLSDDYAFIRNYIPDGKSSRYSIYEYFNRSKNETPRIERKAIEKETNIAELNYTIQNGVFGEGLGMYPSAFYDRLVAIRDELQNESGADFNLSLVTADELQQEVKKAFRRYSFEDTLKLCRELFVEAEADTAKYPQAATKAFGDVLTEVNYTQITTPEEEYDALIKLEKAYNTLIDATIR